MLGVVRRASSLDSLEMERSAATKFPKSDALSIYEATLQKLRLGSRRAFTPEVPATSPVANDSKEIKLPVSAVNDTPSSCTSPPPEVYISMEEDFCSQPEAFLKKEICSPYLGA